MPCFKYALFRKHGTLPRVLLKKLDTILILRAFLCMCCNLCLLFLKEKKLSPFVVQRVLIMAAEVDDVDDKNEENILYDLAVVAEWKFENEIFVSTHFLKVCFIK